MAAVLDRLLDEPGLKPLPGPIKARISIEALLQWAFSPGRDGGATWKADPALAMDRGLTAKPRRRPRGSWILAEACAGMRFKTTGPVHLCATTDGDAQIVASAVQGLPSRLAGRVRAQARAKCWPDWLDTETRLEKKLDDKGRVVILWTSNYHKKTQYCPLATVIDRVLNEQSKARYTEWRGALEVLHSRLVNRLERWELNLYLPPEEPWK